MARALFSFLLLLVVQCVLAQPDTTDNSLVAYHQKYALGNRSTSFLKQYIRKLDSLDQPVDQQLLDEYVGTLQVRDLDNFETVSFLLQQGPILQSKTYRLIYMNQTIVDSIYHKLPLDERKKINGKIIKNTTQKAIQEKDINLAYNLSSFMYNAWLKSNPFLADIEQDRVMVEYLEQVADTTQYFRRAVNYYDRVYLYSTPDSMLKMNLAAHDNKPYRQPLDSAMQARWEHIPEARKRQYDTLFAKSLHRAAASFIKLGAKGPYIYNSLHWIQAAIKWRNDVPEYYHTYATILASLQLLQEAISKEEQAIKLADRQQQDTSRYRRQLQALREALQKKKIFVADVTNLADSNE
ncbi:MULTISPECIES: hypothetical protein [Olivibacter]|uniref:Uncharacterized protein n=1 Tax=Olivibacter oleidegradans TaxID=760123 RepID=A0ABV6HDU1_9SPHI|nr:MULTISPECIES: hypothetical protein [Olivibacter]MDM8178093.1 hypothetical protein [Olivibacter sp. 47]QEK99395.1 hypothetical protein FKG96_00825 [Olivibacter sp. LS-1]